VGSNAPSDTSPWVREPPRRGTRRIIPITTGLLLVDRFPLTIDAAEGDEHEYAQNALKEPLVWHKCANCHRRSIIRPLWVAIRTPKNHRRVNHRFENPRKGMAVEQTPMQPIQGNASPRRCVVSLDGHGHEDSGPRLARRRPGEARSRSAWSPCLDGSAGRTV
jgi:hypothetical protein